VTTETPAAGERVTMSVSTQLCWQQPWWDEAATLLRDACGALGLVVTEPLSQEWDSSTATVGGIRDVELSYVGGAGPRWSFLHLPLNTVFAEGLAVKLSVMQPHPLLEFHEYHDTCWGYRLLRGGDAIDAFVNMPEVIDEEPALCRGNADQIAKAFGIPHETVAPYLQHLADNTATPTRAHPDDEFPLSNHWVRVDFMRRLGIEYLDPSQGKGLYLHITSQ
jgi:hypothetical protein